MFGSEVILRIGARRACRIVISGNGIYRYTHATDHGASARNSRSGRLAGIEEVTTHDNEFGILFACQGTKALKGFDALRLKYRPVFRVVDLGKRFAKLPIGGVDERDNHVWPLTLAGCARFNPSAPCLIMSLRHRWLGIQEKCQAAETAPSAGFTRVIT